MCNPPCEICGCDTMHFLFEKEGFSYQICSNCKLIRIFPQPSAQELDAIYNGGYYKRWGVSESVFYDLKRYTAEKMLDELPPSTEHARFLDIGAATGIMMEAAANRGYEVYGVEVSRDGAEAIIEKFGQHRVVNQYFDAAFDAYSNGHFYVLCMSELFEHVRQPGNVLDKAHSLLSESGYLLMSVPNTSSLSCKLLGHVWPNFIKQHLFSFSLDNLKILLQKHNFDLISTKPHTKYLTAKYAANKLTLREGTILQIFAKILRLAPQKFASIPFPIHVGEVIVLAQKKTSPGE